MLRPTPCPRPPVACAPRHLVPPGDLKKELRLQIITVESQQCSINWSKPHPSATRPCADVQDNKYFADAKSRTTDQAIALKPWDQEHMIHIYGRTADGYSVHLQVHSWLTVAVEFPETHGDVIRDIKPYFAEVEKELELERHSLVGQVELEMRARSNNWVPDPTDPTKPKRYPVVNISFKNKQTMTKVVKFMQNNDVACRAVVPGSGKFPIRVSVWETVDYVKPQQRFLLENNVAPGGWICVSNASPLQWTCTTCDYEAHCLSTNIRPDDSDQSICPITMLSWDTEVRNGTAAEYARMKSMGLDKFPNASDPTNSVIQVSVCVRTADGRTLRFLLELDDEGVHTGDAAVATRTFQGEEYSVIFFQAEADMLVFFRDIMVYYDPDMVVTFNGDRFDWPYIVARMGDRRPRDAHGRFLQMGRFVSDRWETSYTPYRTDGKTERPVVSGDADETYDLPQKHFPIAQLAMERGVQLTPQLKGRISLDLCSLIRSLSTADKYLAFKNYTLNNMAERFLQDKKVDFSHTDIFAAWAGMMTGQRFLQILSGEEDPESTSWLSTPVPNEAEVDAWLGEISDRSVAMLRIEAQAKQDEFAAANIQRKAEGLTPLSEPEPVTSVSQAAQRRLLGDYCMKDTLLPLRIMDKLGTVMFLWQVARVSKTPPDNIINNGQMARVSAMFVGEAWAQRRVVNRVMNRAMKYEGATVLKPKRGYYGGGAGQELVHSGKPPLPADVCAGITMPVMPASKKQRPSAEALRADIEAQVARMDPALLEKHNIAPQDVVAAALDAADHLPDGYDFSNMTLAEVQQTKTAAAILTLDFKSLYPSIMLTHRLCPSTLFQPDEPPTASELSAAAFRAAVDRAARVAPPAAAAAAVAAPRCVFPFARRDAADPSARKLDLERKLELESRAKEEIENILQGMDESNPEYPSLWQARENSVCAIDATQRQLTAEIPDVTMMSDVTIADTTNMTNMTGMTGLTDTDADADADEEETDGACEVDLDNDTAIEGDASGEVKGLSDEADYTTICIVVTDSKGAFVKRRYHKYTKHDNGIYPVMLQQLLDGRDLYKKKMNLEKAVEGSLELAFAAMADAGGSADVSDADINSALEELRAAIKPAMKDQSARAQATAAWIARHAAWVFAAQARIMRIVGTLVCIYDGRQKALKVMANSIYGVSGAKQHSPCACCMLAESVTAVGRQMIKASRDCVLTVFAHYGCDVVYGDTDSIFVCIQEPDDRKAWAIATEIAGYITRVVFAGTVNELEDECIKRYLALFKKKTYVALENEDVKTGIYKRGEKGIASVRRDKPEVLNILVRQLNKAFTELGNFSRETIARVLTRLCCNHLENMVQDNFSVDDYAIFCRINKMNKESAHVNLARMMEMRTGTPVITGNGVSFVQIVKHNETKAARRVESPVAIKADSSIKIDRAYYLSHKVRPIIQSTLELFLPPEVIDTIFDVYQTVLDMPGMQTVAHAFGLSTSPSSARRERAEIALSRAVASGRLPNGNKLPEPLTAARAKRAKPTAAEAEQMRSANMARFRTMLESSKRTAPLGSAPQSPQKRPPSTLLKAAPAPAPKKGTRKPKPADRKQPTLLDLVQQKHM